MAANRTISIRLTVAEADQFKQAFQQAGAAGQAAMNTLTQSVTASTGALHGNTQAAGLANYQIIELTESAHKFADIILSGGSAIRGLEFELPKFIGIAGGITNALSAVGKALPLIGIAAAAAGIYELGKSADEQQSRLRLLGQQVRATRDDYDAYAVTLDKTARALAQHTTLNTKDARDTVNAIGTNANFSGNASDLTRLATDAADLSVVLKTDLAGGAKVVTDGLNDAAKAAKELGDKGINGFTPDLVRSIELLQQGGKYADAFALFLKTVEVRSSGAAEAGLTPLGAALKRLDEAFNGSRDGAKSWSEAIGGFFDTLATRGITNLARLIEKMDELTKATDSSKNPALNVPTGDAYREAGSTDFKTALAQAESTNNPTKVNSLGYTGLYQQGTGRLANLGLYQPAPGESLDSNQWRGQLNIPGFPGVKSQDDFRMNAQAQQAAMDAEMAQDRQAIAALGSAAQGYSPTGLMGVAHLGGLGGMRKFVTSGGSYNPDDGNRSLSDYYRAFASYGSTIPSGVPQYTDGATDPARGVDLGHGQYGPNPPGYSTSDDMINAGRKSDEAVSGMIEGSRAATGEKLAATLEGIEKQLQAFEVSGRQNTTEYAGLQQREQETRAAIYNNVDPQTQANRQGQRQLDSARLARRYGFTPAGDQMAAGVSQREDLARTSGSPFTDQDRTTYETQYYAKATMELTRLEDTQKRATAGSESLAQAYLKGGTAVADYTARNQALEQINSILPETAANYRAELDKLTDSYRKLAQGAADAAAAQRVAADTKATSLSAQQDMLIRSGVGPDQQAITMAGLTARQQNSDASAPYQDAAISAAKRQAQTDLALQNTKANYSELTNFASNSFDKIGSDITQAFTQGATAAKSFGDIGKAVISDLSQELIKLSVINPIKNALLGTNSSLPTISGVGGILGSLLGNSGNSNATNAALAGLGGVDGPATASQVSAAQGAITNGTSGGSFFSSLFHGGGIAGRSSGAGMRMVDPSVFYGAQRLHTGGIAGDEVPTVLKAGEGVFTPGQMAALGAGAVANSNGGDTHLHLNINAQGAGPREIDTLKNQIPGMALAAVQNAMTRNGKFANQVRGRSS